MPDSLARLEVGDYVYARMCDEDLRALASRIPSLRVRRVLALAASSLRHDERSLVITIKVLMKSHDGEFDVFMHDVDRVTLKTLADTMATNPLKLTDSFNASVLYRAIGLENGLEVDTDVLLNNAANAWPEAVNHVRSVDIERLDIVYVTDYRSTNAYVAMVDLEHLIDLGLSVGLLHLTSPLDDGSSWQPARGRIDAMVAMQKAAWLSLSDRTDARIVVVRDPATMQFLDERSSGISAADVVIVGGALTDDRLGGATFDPLRVVGVAGNLFGSRVSFAPTSSKARAFAKTYLDPRILTIDDWRDSGAVRVHDKIRKSLQHDVVLEGA